MLRWAVLPKSFGGTNFIAWGNLVSPSLISHAHYQHSLTKYDIQCSSFKASDNGLYLKNILQH